jgi:hypothetical protein
MGETTRFICLISPVLAQGGLLPCKLLTAVLTSGSNSSLSPYLGYTSAMKLGSSMTMYQMIVRRRILQKTLATSERPTGIEDQMILSPPVVALACRQLLQHAGSPHVLKPREIPTVRSICYFTRVSASGNGERRQRYKSWQFLGVRESPS